MDQNSNFPCAEPQNIGQNELVNFVRNNLTEDSKQHLGQYILEQSEKYGYYWAMAIKYLR